MDPPAPALSGLGRTLDPGVEPPDEREALTADRLIVVGRGRLIAEGTVDDVVRRSSTGHVAGVTLYELSTHSASLEEAFMELTRDAVEYMTRGAAA